MAKNIIFEIYNLLYKAYGPQGWWPILKEKEVRKKYGVYTNREPYFSFYHPNDFSYPKNREQVFEICIGAILTQNTAWKNVEKALINLKRYNLLNCETIMRMNKQQLGEFIKPAGYYNQKSERLKRFAEWFSELNGKPKREELLSLKGIGPETADSILLYAFNIPSFVVDAYTKRILHALGLIKRDSKYDEIKALFERNLPRDFKLYQEYHALLVEHAKNYYSGKKDKKEEDFLISALHL